MGQGISQYAVGEDNIILYNREVRQFFCSRVLQNVVGLCLLCIHILRQSRVTRYYFAQLFFYLHTYFLPHLAVETDMVLVLQINIVISTSQINTITFSLILYFKHYLFSSVFLVK